VYNANITHNLGKMAEKAGLYETLWRPYRLKQIMFNKMIVIEGKFEGASTTLARGNFSIMKRTSRFKIVLIILEHLIQNGWEYMIFFPLESI
jgi:hypothetical protein